MKTTTADSLLGLLSMGPMSGYQIKQRIDESIGNFWTESYGQIYPTLKRLHGLGLIESRSDATESTSGRPSRVYELTAAGHQRVRQWLGMPTQPQVNRNELLLKVFFCDQAGPHAARERVLEARERFVRDLRRYNRIAAELPKRAAQHPGLPYWMMTVRYGIAQAKALIDWANEALLELDAMGSATEIISQTREEVGV